MSEEKRFIDKILLENANLKARVNELVVEIDELQEDKLDLTNMNEEWEDKYVELVGGLRVKIEYILKNRLSQEHSMIPDLNDILDSIS